ncbi:precorrin-3B C(17)-methyltransferase [Anaerostipes sp.]|uniref:precorrin-3B C(17)-methyltransferase n=1 Tax=Anaerostipes sp. TaxID=1872530 RepID=UPI0025BE48B6|nr:precorrin-3B C(17)-methyltransferase [Anaerostipes sp.]MBS7007395.1 precorrin-3B C(17)-methyltransferase [Anaerostipes sp.]
MSHKVYVVGIGPGDFEQMTVKAAETLKKSDVIIGYTVYIDLVREHLPGREFLSTSMTKEAERCRMAYKEAEKNRTVSMICSGDAGVYGMAGLMYEIGADYPDIEVEIVPGVTAATAGAALLGAPLTHDFCVISLSDLLTPWPLIEDRLLAAAKADFSVCLYNPSSKKRRDHLKKACDLMLRYKSPDTVCGMVKNIGRQGEEKEILTLHELRNAHADMFTTVFVGNSQTKIVSGAMVTPRGYKDV